MISTAVLHATLSFAIVAGLLTIIPGLDTAVVLRTAIVGGRARAFATASGIFTGSLIWGVAAAAGVSALLTASQVAYTTLRIVGAGYLVWMGFGMLRGALRRTVSAPSSTALGDAAAAAAEPSQPQTIARAWARGLGTNLLNPKIGIVYTAMLPQFIPAGSSHLAMGALLALVHDAEGLVWFTAIILTAHTARSLLSRPSVKRFMDAVTGTVLVGFGLKLAAERR